LNKRSEYIGKFSKMPTYTTLGPSLAGNVQVGDYPLNSQDDKTENVVNGSTDAVVIAVEFINTLNTLARLKKCQRTQRFGRAQRVTCLLRQNIFGLANMAV